MASRLERWPEMGMGTGMGTGTGLKDEPGRGGCLGGMSDDCGVEVGGG